MVKVQKTGGRGKTGKSEVSFRAWATPVKVPGTVPADVAADAAAGAKPSQGEQTSIWSRRGKKNPARQVDSTGHLGLKWNETMAARGPKTTTPKTDTVRVHYG